MLAKYMALSPATLIVAGANIIHSFPVFTGFAQSTSFAIFVGKANVDPRTQLQPLPERGGPMRRRRWGVDLPPLPPAQVMVYLPLAGARLSASAAAMVPSLSSRVRSCSALLTTSSVSPSMRM